MNEFEQATGKKWTKAEKGGAVEPRVVAGFNFF